MSSLGKIAISPVIALVPIFFLNIGQQVKGILKGIIAVQREKKESKDMIWRKKAAQRLHGKTLLQKAFER